MSIQTYIEKRETTPEYLQVALEQKKQEVAQLQARLSTVEIDWHKKSDEASKLAQQLEETKTKLSREIINLNLANKKLGNTVEALEADKGELEYMLETTKKQAADAKVEAEHALRALKEDFELAKLTLSEKSRNLENQLQSVNQAYHVGDSVQKDREQIVRDYQKDGEFNSGAVRATILQNQQLNNQLEFQSKQTVLLLERNEKLLEQVAHFKRQIEIHKQVENDLVKRSTLAQALIKQLNKKTKDLEAEHKALREQVEVSSNSSIQTSKPAEDAPDLKAENRKLQLENSSLRNSVNYLENKLLMHETKYESLAVILSQYLEVLMLGQKAQGVYSDIQPQLVELSLNDLRQKDVKEWKAAETQAVVCLLLEQIRPLMSVTEDLFQKKNLLSFPDTKNINVSLVEQPSKDPISLPKISTQHEELVDGDSKKKQNRFKDVPLDISTKIVRSDLRGWGQRIEFGGKHKKKKSNSVYDHKSMLAP